MQHFINEFEIKEKIEKLQTFSTSYDPNLSSKRLFGYKVASQVSRKLTKEMQVPVASVGTFLVTSPDVGFPKMITLPIKLDDGLPHDVEVGITKSKMITAEDDRFTEAVKKYLNRKVDLLMLNEMFTQDGRGFYEERAKSLSKYYSIRRGIWLATHISKTGAWTLVVDPLTQVRAKLNLLEALKLELDRRNLSHWKQAVPFSDEINKSFRSKAYTLRSVYVEPRQENPEHNIYKFIGFRLDKGLSEDSDPRNPVNFHRRFNRSFDMDQPEVMVLAKGGFRIRHIPQLLEEHPSLRMLKRFGVSERAHAQSLINATERYYETVQLIKPLTNAEFIEPVPTEVEVKEFKPVRITISGGYIELKSNLDFQKYFEKGKLLEKPKISAIHMFATAEGAEPARRLKQALSKVFKHFKLLVPEIKEHFDCTEKLEDFIKYVLDTSKEEGFGKTDLALVIFSFGEQDIEDIAYNTLKRESFSRLFPVQFVGIDTILAEDKDLRKDVANPLFIQIVAKCFGKPYGLQPGFMPEGTLVVGIDKYRDPFKEKAPLVNTVVLFDNTGTYVCGNSKPAIGQTSTNIYPLLNSCFEKLVDKTHREKWRRVLFFEDTGVGTMEEYLKADALDCERAAKDVGAFYAFITANKSSHFRLYAGDPADDLSAERASPFSAAIRMRDLLQFLAVSTEPVISREKAKEFGTPRPVLYEVFSKNEELDLEELKETAAKIVVWLCRHSWISPSSTRLPAPLYFANKLSKLVSDTGVSVGPDEMEAPLFL